MTFHRLIRVCKRSQSKYTRSKVRKALPKDFAYIIEELLYEREDILNKEAYYNEIGEGEVGGGGGGVLGGGGGGGGGGLGGGGRGGGL